MNNIARFAAFLTILVAVADPFSQLIVGIVPCARESETLTAFVARTNSYLVIGGHTGPLDVSFGALPRRGVYISNEMSRWLTASRVRLTVPWLLPLTPAL